MNKPYFVFLLEIALKDPNDPNIYAFTNVSHIPTSKLIEIFDINLNEDPDLIEGYFLTQPMYKAHQEYIVKNISQINIDVFEYCLRLYVIRDLSKEPKAYKESLME